MYADDICIMADSKDKLQLILDEISSCTEEYGLKVSEKKSKVVCINSKVGDRQWKLGTCTLKEVNEYVYLGVTVIGGEEGGFRSMGDRMKDANSILGMVKFAANRSGSRFIVGREGWKGLVVSKLMFSAGALVWYQKECDDLEVMQNDLGRWVWNVGTNVRTELLRGETGWSSFEEREAKAMVACLLRIIFEDNLISEIGRACLIEIGGKSRWWSRLRHICNKYDMSDLVNLICLGDISKNGLGNLNLSLNLKVWRKGVDTSIKESACKVWKDGLRQDVTHLEYVDFKRVPGLESYAKSGAGARMRLWVRGGCMPVRNNERMHWKYDSNQCVCGEVETEHHILFECNRYEADRREWQHRWIQHMGDACMLKGLKGYLKSNDDLDNHTLRYMSKVWNTREKNEGERMRV